MFKSFWVVFFAVVSLAGLTGCQHDLAHIKVIASTFNMTTTFQKNLLEYDAPKNIDEQRNVRYQLTPPLHFDVYQAQSQDAARPAPSIVWIHGGGWIAGSKQHARGYFQRLADEGYNVIAIEYQFAPEHIYPTQLEQINQAMGYLNRYAAHYQIDMQNLFFAGDSAGANLASHYAALVTHPSLAQHEKIQTAIRPEQLRGLILHCGIYDLNAFVDTADQQFKIVEWAVLNLVQAYTGGRKQDAEFLKQISPIQYLHSAYPAVFISSGNKDFLTKTQAYPFVKALKAQNIPVTEVFYPDSSAFLMHEYQFFMGKKESQQTFARTLDFIEQQRVN